MSMFFAKIDSLGYIIRKKWRSSSVLVRIARWPAINFEFSKIYESMIKTIHDARITINLMRFDEINDKDIWKEFWRWIFEVYKSLKIAIFKITTILRSFDCDHLILLENFSWKYAEYHSNFSNRFRSTTFSEFDRHINLFRTRE